MTAVLRPRRTGGLATAWRAAWPVLAGAVTAVGLLGAWHLTSLLAVVAMVAGLWLFCALTLYGVGSESGLRAGTAVRIGLIGSMSTVALLGLVDLFPVAGWIVALSVGVSAPAVADLAASHVRRAAAATGWLRASRGSADQDAVDKAFEQIVSDIDNDAA
jgi:hypothetical protein